MTSVKEIDLHITRECDNRCAYCYVAPNNLELRTIVNNCEPVGDTKRLKAVITAIREVAGAEDLVFVGGDPCRHPDLVQLLQHAKEKRLNTVVLSNTHSYQNGGVAVDIAEAAEYIDEVDFTLHGYSPEMHDEFTKNPGSYSVATKNLKRFIETRKEDKPVGIILNLVPEIVTNLTKIMGSIANKIGMKPGLDFFTIQRIAPAGMAMANYKRWKITPEMIGSAFSTFAMVKIILGFETKVCIDALPWCSVPEKYWEYLEPLRGGCNWGKPDGVLSAMMTGELQRCALCQDTLGVNILDLKNQEEFSVFMETHPTLVAVRNRSHLDDKCLNCKHLEYCGGGCIIAAGGDKGDPYANKLIRRGHDYLAK